MKQIVSIRCHPLHLRAGGDKRCVTGSDGPLGGVEFATHCLASIFRLVSLLTQKLFVDGISLWHHLHPVLLNHLAVDELEFGAVDDDAVIIGDDTPVACRLGKVPLALARC